MTDDKLAEVLEGFERTEVILFKPSGKYYTTEDWRIPEDAIGPYDMTGSPDFHQINGGPVLVTDQAWGFPALLGVKR